MNDLNYGLKKLCDRNQDGSFATRANRQGMLTMMGNQLREMGYQHMHVESLKPKHVDALLTKWSMEGVAVGTVKNRMSALRWWSEKIGKPNVIARQNDSYGIAKRVFVTNVSKAKVLDGDKLNCITDPYTVMSLKLEAAFGLRREESIKLIPVWADLGEVLRLKDSWTKGGKSREIPIRTAEQKAVLREAKQLAGTGSLIPRNMSYRDQLNRFRSQCSSVGIHRVHGLRHQYAQTLYHDLTGWLSPAAGGPSLKQLTAEQKVADRNARQTISIEMGHHRIQITSVYLGS